MEAVEDKREAAEEALEVEAAERREAAYSSCPRSPPEAS